MSKNVNINLRINSEIKEEAGKILENIGLTFSDAFNLLLHQIKIQRKLPFELTDGSYICEYGYLHSAEYYQKLEESIMRIENGEEEMLGPFETFEDYLKSLEGDDDE